MEQIIEILMRRDGLTYNEARNTIDKCINEIDIILKDNGSYDEVVDTLYYWLGLEPDYLDILLAYLQ